MGAKTFNGVQAKIQRLTEAKSSEEIAKILNEAGVKGVPATPDRCPIANYLNKSMRTRRYEVGLTQYGKVYRQKSGILQYEPWVDSTPAMRKFIREFDSMEKWQELLDESVGV